MIKYINAKTGNLTETLEEMNSDDYPSLKDFNNAVYVRMESYSMIHKKSDVYISNRCVKSWTGN